MRKLFRFTIFCVVMVTFLACNRSVSESGEAHRNDAPVIVSKQIKVIAEPVGGEDLVQKFYTCDDQARAERLCCDALLRIRNDRWNGVIKREASVSRRLTDINPFPIDPNAFYDAHKFEIDFGFPNENFGYGFRLLRLGHLEAALEHFNIAANSGHPGARYKLGQIHDGQCELVDRDKTKAYLWFAATNQIFEIYGLDDKQAREARWESADLKVEQIFPALSVSEKEVLLIELESLRVNIDVSRRRSREKFRERYFQKNSR